jgi:hypothetical protein
MTYHWPGKVRELEEESHEKMGIDYGRRAK